MAVSLDGYVARLNSAVDFLEKYPLADFDFDEWAERIGTLVMGRKNYRQLLEWGEWLWDAHPTLALPSTTNLAASGGTTVTFRSAPSAKAITEWSAQAPKRLWVFGGGNVMAAALLGNVVDTLALTIMPESLCKEISLFSEPYRGPMRTIHSVWCDNGAIRLVYDTTTVRAW